MTREDALKWLDTILTQGEQVDALEMAIEALESQKTGHWIADVDKWGGVVITINGYKCSECGKFNDDKDNYCPNCGANMKGE